ncbi:MAG: hypothetical protein RL732_36 [Bacteroidota bacterium]|jgi:hypothetical protein
MNKEDLPLIPGVIADYYYDPSGILYSFSNDKQRTVENIRDNIALVKKITGNKKVPLLVFLKRSPVPDKATRKFSTNQLPEVYTAMAMVSKPGLSAFIMKLLFHLNPPPIPMRSFSNEEEAKEWLMPYR